MFSICFSYSIDIDIVSDKDLFRNFVGFQQLYSIILIFYNFGWWFLFYIDIVSVLTSFLLLGPLAYRPVFWISLYEAKFLMHPWYFSTSETVSEVIFYSLISSFPFSLEHRIAGKAGKNHWRKWPAQEIISRRNFKIQTKDRAFV